MKIFPKNWLAYKIHDAYLGKKVRTFANSKLRYVGCGEKPYAEIVKPYVTEYISVYQY